MSLHRNTKYGLIFLIVLSLISMSTIIHDNKQRPLVDQLQPVDADGIKQYMPLSNDWVIYDQSMFEDDGTNTGFVVTGILPSQHFKKGDRLRIKQGSTYQYAYAVGVEDYTETTGLISVASGDDYLINTTISEFASSKVINPIGFPDTFTFEIPLLPSAGSLSSVTYSIATFNVIGNTCYMDLLITFTPSTTTDYVDFLVPVQPIYDVGSSRLGGLYYFTQTANSGVDLVSDISDSFFKTFRFTTTIQSNYSANPVTLQAQIHYSF